MTALSTEPAAATSVLRLVPAPCSAPPYDDEPGPRPHLRLVTEPLPAALDVADPDAWLQAFRTPTAQLPSSRAFARRLLQGLLEALAGVRPVAQLRRDTTPELYAVLVPRICRARDLSGPRPDGHAVRSLHLQERPEGVVEVCATVVRGTRMGALALRLEGLDGRWQCTEMLGL